ncbi:MAG TPA: N-acetylglucosamine-6-phosphate deacetylase [Rhizomicrobium sp.]|jgi:N-acetylglucosamine-6-phosphate deacetylase
MTLFANAQVLTEHGFQPANVRVHEDRIAEIESKPPASGEELIDLHGHLLLPGYVDVQVNGGGGVLFGDAPSVEGLRKLGEAHAQFGTTSFLPTIISSDLNVVRAAIAAVDSAIAGHMPGVVGIHIEGPFLSPERKGVHDASKFRALDAEAFALLTSLKRGKTLVTLAPEETTPQTIRRLTQAGVIVSAGHTDATYAETKDAIDHGLTGFTHLFNAMSQLTPREAGAVGAALDSDAWCGLIADGRHVALPVMRIALRCKGSERLMLVTDAMPSVGSPLKTFRLQGQMIRVEDGVCVAPDGTLAGSDLDMASAVRNAMQMMQVQASAAARMASENPARFLGLQDRIGRIAPGCRADLIEADEHLNILRVWSGGELIVSQ